MSGHGSPKFVFLTGAANRVVVFGFIAALISLAHCSLIFGQELYPLRSTSVASNTTANLLNGSPANISGNETSVRTTSPDRNLRLRISWGGGIPQTWTGRITVTEGAFSDVAPLGLDPDANAAVMQVGRDLEVGHWSPTGYGGADVTLTGNSETRVHLELSSIEQPESTFERTMTFDELIEGRIGGEIDLSGNRCSVSRVPGDQLRVIFEREHLVFQPGEEFTFSVVPNATALARRSANCRVRLIPAHPTKPVGLPLASRPLVSQTLAVQLDENGSAQPQQFSLVVPIEEAVYEIEIELDGNRYPASLNYKKNAIRRSVQLLVLEAEARQSEPQEWREVFAVDAVEARQEPFPAWSQISRIAGLPVKTTLGNELRSPVVVQQQTMMQLLPGGWQAIPLSMERVGKPHVIELEYVADGETAIGISLLQPDAAGQIPTYGFDSGVYIPKSLVPSSAEEGKIARHRLTVWPDTKTPYLLVANRHGTANATLGSIKVFTGPDRIEVNGVSQPSDGNRRKLMAFYETPLFAQNFAAPAQVDPDVAQPLQDWRTFYEGADRFIEYLKANRYHGAFVTVASEGSSIYPSPLLAPSPKYDNGTFFGSGQDPIRKDVLEMLFRMFQREGLVLVPTLAMSGPLPEVEVLRKRDGSSSEFELFDLNGARRKRAMNGRLPEYNPLNPTVQRAVRRIVEELAERYKSHQTFTGVAVVCRPDTCTLLPGRQWGYDPNTVQQFFQSQPDLGSMPGQWTDVQAILLGSHRPQWIQWRASRMTRWYQDLAAGVKRALPEGRLYVAPIDLYRNDETASALSPSLHSSTDFEQAMLHLGFEPSLVGSNADTNLPTSEGDIAFLNPHRIAPDQPLSSRRVELAVENSKQAQAYFSRHVFAGDLFTHRISWAHFAQLQDQSPFGDQQSALMRLQQMAPAGSLNRQRFVQSIKDRDARMLVDGGWMITMGQEEAIQEMMQVYGQLPDARFADVVSKEHPDLSTRPLAVRQFEDVDSTTFYVANASPWETRVTLILNSNSAAAPIIESLSDRALIAQPQLNIDNSSKVIVVSNSRRNEYTYEVSLQVPAYGLLGGRLPTDCRIVDFGFTLPEDIDKDLRRHVYALQAKLTRSGNPQPLPVLANADFESGGQPAIIGWDTGQQSTGNVRLESNRETTGGMRSMGQTSLWMENDEARPVWVRSNVFEATETGRISISVWLKTNDPANQPPLRLALEGQSRGASYYRFGSVGSLSPDPNANQIEERWKRFAVHFDDLPVEGMSNVRIGFDLMGPGQVSIDNVQVLDRWFDENDTKAITQMLASTGPLLSKPATFDRCRRLLESYWPSFLDQFIEMEDLPGKVQKTPTQGKQLDSIPEMVERQASAVDSPEERDGNDVGADREGDRRAPMFRRFRNLVPQHKSDLR